MPVVDLNCRDSFSAPAPGCQECRREALFLGYDGRIFLLFDSPADFSARMLRKADLILFKLPYLSSPAGNGTECAGHTASQYALYPLLDFFSVFGGAFSPPAVDFGRRVCFQDISGRGYTEIDVTQIVRDWSCGKLENRGVLLAAFPDSPCLYYASSRYRILWMRPMLRLTYQKIELPRTLRAVPCEVKIKNRVSSGVT